MPIQDHFPLPSSAQELPLGDDSTAKLFIAFISSKDPTTKQSWCPDVRAALPRLDAEFTGRHRPELAYVHVGQRPEYVPNRGRRAPTEYRVTNCSLRWKIPNNLYRKVWNVNFVPTLVRYQRVNGKVVEKGRLVEGELLDPGKLRTLVDD